MIKILHISHQYEIYSQFAEYRWTVRRPCTAEMMNDPQQQSSASPLVSIVPYSYWRFLAIDEARRGPDAFTRARIRMQPDAGGAAV